MPTARITPDLEMHYEVDDYTDPWTRPETVLLLHGNAESAEMWFGWVPTLARHLRVVRTDMRGFARSTPMPRDYKWTLDRVIDDFVVLIARRFVSRSSHRFGALLERDAGFHQTLGQEEGSTRMTHGRIQACPDTILLK